MSKYNEDERKRWGANYDDSQQQPSQNSPMPLQPQQGQAYGPPPTQNYQRNPLQSGWNAPSVRTATMGKVSMWLAATSVVPSIVSMIISLVLVNTGSYNSPYNYDTPFALLALIGIVTITSPMVGLAGVIVAIIALAKDAGKKYALIAFGIFGIGAVLLFIGAIVSLLNISI